MSENRVPDSQTRNAVATTPRRRRRKRFHQFDRDTRRGRLSILSRINTFLEKVGNKKEKAEIDYKNLRIVGGQKARPGGETQHEHAWFRGEAEVASGLLPAQKARSGKKGGTAHFLTLTLPC